MPACAAGELSGVPALCRYFLCSLCSGATRLAWCECERCRNFDQPQGRSVATRWAGQTENAEDAAALAADPATIPADDNVTDVIVRAEAGKSPTIRLEGRCLGRCTVVVVFSSRPVVREIVITPIRCGYGPNAACRAETTLFLDLTPTQVSVF